MPGAAGRPCGPDVYRGADLKVADCFANEVFGIWKSCYAAAQAELWCASTFDEPVAVLGLWLKQEHFENRPTSQAFATIVHVAP